MAVRGVELLISRSTLYCLRPRSVVVWRSADRVNGAAFDVSEEFVPDEDELSDDGEMLDEVRDEVGDDIETGEMFEPA